MTRYALLLLCAACGGGSSESQPTASPSSAPSATEAAPTASAADDSSPPSIGTKHAKVGAGWFLSGGGKDAYDAIYEPDTKVVVMKPKYDTQGRWATVMKNVSSAPYIGKKIRVRIGVKTNGVTHGEVWARSAAPHASEDAPSITTPLAATSEMKDYDVTLDVKDGTRVVEYGISIAGPGELRVGKDAIDIL